MWVGTLRFWRRKGVKDVRVALPPGFVGNPNAVPKCSYHDFLDNVVSG